MKKFQIGQIVENKLPGAKKPTTVVCRIVAHLNIGGEFMYRLTDARETRDDAWLVANNRTWAAPAGNVTWHDDACTVCHKDGLVAFG